MYRASIIRAAIRMAAKFHRLERLFANQAHTAAGAMHAEYRRVAGVYQWLADEQRGRIHANTIPGRMMRRAASKPA